LHDWLKTPPGQYLLSWENEQFGQIVADMFGYHALQLGLPDLHALDTNRMPHRWLAIPEMGVEVNPEVDLVTDFAALPFFENSLDLLVLPHSLELSSDPYATLREAERVLVPEGKLVICGFNPLSLWGFKQKRSRLYRRFNVGDLYLPEAGEFIGYRRLRDWLRLLNFEVEPGHFGCYRPAVRSERMLQRFAWMDKIGEQSWPILGAVYFVVAVKRVRGMRLISPLKNAKIISKNAPVSVANKSINTSAREKFNE
jgi:SAM-dependent methyltransferase